MTLTDLEEREQAAEALREIEEFPALGIDDLLRTSQAHLQFALRWGGLTEALDGISGVVGLVDQSTDPIVRTGFLQTYGSALSLSARYAESHEIAERQMTEAQRLGLEWVTPHALEMRAIADFGLRHFERALKTLRRAHHLASEQGNVHTQVNTVVLAARVHLARGSPDRAVQALGDREVRFTSPGMEGENLATHGLALACCGRVDEARNLLDRSDELTSHLEARVLRAFARSIASHFDDPGGRLDLDLLKNAAIETIETGNFDGFVCAYRSFPILLGSLADLQDVDTGPLRRLVHSLDPALGETAGLGPAPRERSASTQLLTSREREVLDLVRQGLTNREIARTLWIAESTVKAHIRHVFEKLGTRSRTEAAARMLSDS